MKVCRAAMDQVILTWCMLKLAPSEIVLHHSGVGTEWDTSLLPFALYNRPRKCSSRLRFIFTTAANDTAGQASAETSILPKCIDKLS